MGAAVAPQNTTPEGLRRPDGRFAPGKSGNPGGVYKGIKEIQPLLAQRHGPKVLIALQRLYDIATDEGFQTIKGPGGRTVQVPNVDIRTRIAALDRYILHAARLSGLEAAAGSTRPDEPLQDEGELLERVVQSVVKRSPELVEQHLQLLRGGKP